MLPAAVAQHILHFVRPEVQKFYIRILWMVPIYAVESWFSLRFKDASLYIQTAREAYGAWPGERRMRCAGVL